MSSAAGGALLSRRRARAAALVDAVRPLLGSGPARTSALTSAALGALLLFLFQWGLWRHGPRFALALVVLAVVFLATPIVIELGIGVIVLAMLFSPELPLGAVAARELTLRLEDLLIPLVGVAWIARKALGLDRRELLRDPILPLMALFVGVQLVSTLLGAAAARIDLRSGLLYILKQVEYFAIFFFAFQYADRPRRMRALLVLALATASLVALYNLPQIPVTEVWSRHRISAPAEGATPEPSSIGGYFVIALALLASFALEAPRPRLRRLLWAAAALVFLPFLFTLSRTSYLAFLAMLLLLAWLRRSWRLAAAIGLGLAAAPFLLPRAIVDRLLYTFRDPIKVFGVFDRSFGERVYIWFKAYWNLRQDPILGKGVTAHQVIDSYYARLLIESGVLGLVLFVLIVHRLFRLAAVVRREHPEWWARAYALGFTAALAGLLVHSFSAITFLIVRIMEPFWMLAGVLAAMARAEAASPEPLPRRPAPAALAGAPAARRSLAHG